MIDSKLLEKYNVPVPRYTSYPTVPYWNEGIDIKQWEDTFRKDFTASNSEKGVSLYLHLPFCEKLCTYCGCNKKITINHDVEQEYMAPLLQEWRRYLQLMGEKPVIRELHLGGGTPTFFSPRNLEILLTSIFKDAVLHPEHEFSFEGHPNNTTKEHLQQLYGLGFRRVSFGVQDNDPEVQRIINRIQPFENVQRGTEMARAIGYKSVNFDLIYGLPKQTLAGITRTINQTISLLPDRIAFYSYAHVPWTSRGQRLFDENDLPSAVEKIQLYQTGMHMFMEHGYHNIGMDHFALPNDDLYIASAEGRLHRNFMGYTTQHADILIGLGVSSISSSPNAFAQNAKTIHNYYAYIGEGRPAVEKGYFLSEEDKRFQRYILDISCRQATTYKPEDIDVINRYAMPELKSLEADGLCILRPDGVDVTTLGRNFTRNICSAFDLYLQKSKENKERRLFSKAI